MQTRIEAGEPGAALDAALALLAEGPGPTHLEFAALVRGSASREPELAARCLAAVLERQESDGFLPSPAYRRQFPAASRAGGPAARPGIDPIGTPLLAWAASALPCFRGGDPAGAELYDRLARYVEWIAENRLFADELGLFAWRGLPEWDPASPRFAGARDFCSPDLSSFLALEMEALAGMAGALDLPAAAAGWRERRLQVAEGLNYHMWDDQDGCYYDAGWGGEVRRHPGRHRILPFFAGIASEPRAGRLRNRLAELAGNNPSLVGVLLKGR